MNRVQKTLWRSVAAGALIISLAACGNSAADDARESANNIAAAAQSAAAAASEQLPTDFADSDTDAESVIAETSDTVVPDPVIRKVGKTGWYDGFAITVDTVTAEQSYGDTISVEVDLSYQNLGVEDNSPRDADIEVDGKIIEDFAHTPDIPGGGKADGTVTFDILADDDQPLTFDETLDLVTLVYGDAADNQTKIPLADEAKVDSVEPIELTSTGTLTQGEVIVDVVSGSIAPSYESGEKGKTLVNVRIKLTCAADCNAAGWNTDTTQFSLTGPDGNSVVADDRSEYCCTALYPETVDDNERNVVTFVVKSPGTGAFTLTYDNENITSTGVAPGTFTFTV